MCGDNKKKIIYRLVVEQRLMIYHRRRPTLILSASFLIDSGKYLKNPFPAHRETDSNSVQRLTEANAST